MELTEPTADDLTEKEILLEIYNEVRGIRQFLFWLLFVFIGFVVLAGLTTFLA